MNVDQKICIGRTEAFEMLAGQSNLPKNGREVGVYYSQKEKIETGKSDFVIGKDKNGYYIADII